MECRKARENLHDYLDGALPEPERERLLSHVKSCQSCAGHLAAWERATSVLEAWPSLEPPAPLLHEVMARVRDRAQRRNVLWRSLFYRLVAPLSAAIGLLLLFLPSSGLTKLFPAATSVPVSESSGSVLGDSGQALEGLARQGVSFFDALMAGGAVASIGLLSGLCLVLLAAGALLWNLLERERARRMLRV